MKGRNGVWCDDVLAIEVKKQLVWIRINKIRYDSRV